MRLDETAEAVLGGVVGRGSHAGLMLVHARHDDDAAAVAGVHHAAGGALQHDEGAVEVRREGGAPRFEARLEEEFVPVHPGVVDEDVDAAEARRRARPRRRRSARDPRRRAGSRQRGDRASRSRRRFRARHPRRCAR